MTGNAVSKSLDGHRVYVALQERISSGEYPPGIWLPTERALAEEFGVKRAVIRTALFHLERDACIVREPGCRPWVPIRESPAGSAIESASAVRDLRTVVAIMPQHPIYHASTQILNSINLELRTQEAPYRLTVINSFGDTPAAAVEFERRALQELTGESVAGVIIWHVGHDSTRPLLGGLLNRRIPVVFVDRFPDGMCCDFVGVDNRESAAEAVRYLISLGHRRIAHITSNELSTTVIGRRQGYIDALRSAGISAHNGWICAQDRFDAANMRNAVDHLFRMDEPPTAAFTLNDAIAHYFIASVEATGRTVPGDVSVVGFDDMEIFSPRPALLTTMHQPFDRIGRRAAELLLQRLASNDQAPLIGQHILLSPSLVIRSTCQASGKEG